MLPESSDKVLTMVKNAKQMPKRYYGLHMTEGVAEYPEHAKEGSSIPPRILILENTLKKMDSTFEGLPVFVLQVLIHHA